MTESRNNHEDWTVAYGEILGALKKFGFVVDGDENSKTSQNRNNSESQKGEQNRQEDQDSYDECCDCCCDCGEDELIECDGCGEEFPASEAYYVDACEDCDCGANDDKDEDPIEQLHEFVDTVSAALPYVARLVTSEIRLMSEMSPQERIAYMRDVTENFDF